MSTKMKGLLKGLRYISQIFEEDEEKEMQIGHPTDVKHVAHIGWDGPSVNSPSWMNEFKSPEHASAPLQMNGNPNKDSVDDVKWVSEDKKAKSDSPGRDMLELPKASRRRQPSADSIGSVESPLGSPVAHKSSKPSRRRHSAGSSKDSSSTTRPSSRNKDPGPSAGESLQSLPNIPKKNRRKKSKDGDGSSREIKGGNSSTTSVSESGHGSKKGPDHDGFNDE